MAKQKKAVPPRRVSKEDAIFIGRLRGHMTAMERGLEELDRITSRLDPAVMTPDMIAEASRAAATAWGDTTVALASTRRAIAAITGQ